MAVYAVEIEGTVDDIIPTASGAALSVMGMDILVDQNVQWIDVDNPGSISTPTSKLTIAQLTDLTKLPNRDAQGFKKGTVIAKGNYDPADQTIRVRIQSPPANQGAEPFESQPSITIEPGETVIVGPVTTNAADDFRVNGVKIVLLPDATTNPRLPGLPPRNEEGFKIKLDTVPINAIASVEGYYGNDNAFHAFIIDAPGDLTTTDPQISIQRAEARNRGAEYDIKMRGFITVGHLTPGSPRPRVEIFRLDNGQKTVLGSDSPTVPAGAQFARWRFEASITALAAPLNVAPGKIFAQYLSAPNQPISDLEVEVRID
jgi:hypothetical protein